MTVEVGFEAGWTHGCCGVRQISGFSVPNDDTSDDGWDFTAHGNTVEEAYSKLFNIMYTDRAVTFGHPSSWEHRDREAAVVQIWFYKARDFNGVDEPEYQAETLRQLVATISGVIDLGEHRNPNSGNLIQGYQWAV